MFRLNDLLEVPMTGDFDFKHLQNIHYFLFQDLYAWAGEVRTVDIAKTNLFCKVQFIYVQAEAIFGKLAKEQCLSELPRDIFVKKLAFYCDYRKMEVLFARAIQ